MFTPNPKNQFASVVDGGVILPIFSNATVSKIPLTVGLDLTGEVVDTGLGAGQRVTKSSSLAIASSGASESNVATSPDGDNNWILRTMPSAQIWRVGAAGDNALAIDAGGTATASSTDGGVTWSGATACTTSADSDADNVPVENGGSWIIDSNTASTCAVSSDLGTSWANQTLPADNGMDHFLTVGGLFWYWASGTTAYTSVTGLTGSWTSRTLPITPDVSMIWKNPDEDAIYIADTSGTIRKTVDGINWTDTGVEVFLSSEPHFNLNGVHVAFDVSANHSFVKHGDHLNRFWSGGGGLTDSKLVVTDGGSFLVPLQFGIGLITRNNLLGVFR